MEAGGRLVEEDEFRPMYQCNRQIQTVLHAAGERRNTVVTAVLQFDEVEQLGPRHFSSAGKASTALRISVVLMIPTNLCSLIIGSPPVLQERSIRTVSLTLSSGKMEIGFSDI